MTVGCLILLDIRGSNNKWENNYTSNERVEYLTRFSKYLMMLSRFSALADNILYLMTLFYSFRIFLFYFFFMKKNVPTQKTSGGRYALADLFT